MFYAREDTKSPFRYALMSMIVNAAIAIGLAPFIGFLAAAIGTTLAAWAMVLQLWLGSRSMGDAATLDARFKTRIPRILISAAIMGAALLLLTTLLDAMLHTPTWRYLALAIIVTAAITLYFTATHITGALKLTDIKTALKRS